MIRNVTPADAEAIAAIYNHYIAETTATFEEEPVSTAEMETRIRDTLGALPWVVAEIDGRVVAYAYASRWKSRCAYRYAVESTVYTAPGRTGQGLGTLLYSELFDQLRACGMHSVLAGITLPNDASVALHEKMGFEKVGQFREVGWKFGRWIDVGYWELML
jgi:L-amino acid N-acyltransferase YncA